MQLQWNKCTKNVWCPLLRLNLSHQHFTNLSGVYVIWHSGSNPATVYVGSGNVAERLAAHRANPEITQHSSDGLFVTWARVSAKDQPAVERYLADTLKPLEGSKYPDVAPMPVNLPW